jgi:hypothetical protein
MINDPIHNVGKHSSGCCQRLLCSINKQGVCHTAALPFTLKSYLKAKRKQYGISNISPCKNIIFKKSSERNQNPSRYCNSINNL